MPARHLAAGSGFLRALNHGRDETPGRATAWTTIRSITDEVVQPQTGDDPTSSLGGAANILIQDVCPGRQTSHIGMVVDSVTVAALADAITHKGAARTDRLPPGVCAHPYGTGLDEGQTALFLDLGLQLVGQGQASVPRVRREPKVRSWVKRPG
jgi:triacylglycerol lipase